MKYTRGIIATGLVLVTAAMSSAAASTTTACATAATSAPASTPAPASPPLDATTAEELEKMIRDIQAKFASNPVTSSTRPIYAPTAEVNKAYVSWHLGGTSEVCKDRIKSAVFAMDTKCMSGTLKPGNLPVQVGYHRLNRRGPAENGSPTPTCIYTSVRCLDSSNYFGSPDALATAVRAEIMPQAAYFSPMQLYATTATVNAAWRKWVVEYKEPPPQASDPAYDVCGKAEGSRTARFAESERCVPEGAAVADGGRACRAILVECL